jgi:hypothetical protein
MSAHLESIDDSLNVGLDGLVGELGAGQRTHALQSQVAQVGLPVLQELAQLVAGTDQKIRLTARREQGEEGMVRRSKVRKAMVRSEGLSSQLHVRWGRRNHMLSWENPKGPETWRPKLVLSSILHPLW